VSAARTARSLQEHDGHQITRESSHPLYALRPRIGAPASKTFTASCLLTSGPELAEILHTLPQTDRLHPATACTTARERSIFLTDGDAARHGSTTSRSASRPKLLPLPRAPSGCGRRSRRPELRRFSTSPPTRTRPEIMKPAHRDARRDTRVSSHRLAPCTKSVANIQDTRARGAHVIAIATEETRHLATRTTDLRAAYPGVSCMRLWRSCFRCNCCVSHRAPAHLNSISRGTSRRPSLSSNPRSLGTLTRQVAVRWNDCDLVETQVAALSRALTPELLT